MELEGGWRVFRFRLREKPRSWAWRWEIACVGRWVGVMLGEGGSNELWYGDVFGCLSVAGKSGALILELSGVAELHVYF